MEQEEKPAIDTTQEFKTIALSLSGGGYRASAFHLGAMAYLNKIGLLDKVTIISTVSGGSFTGGLYALYLSRGKSFQDCYDHLFKCMKEVDLIEEGLKTLSERQSTDGMGSHNLINAMSDIYHRVFFDKALFAEILEAKDLHLKELIINATDFEFGLPFRFQASQSPLARIGNGGISIPLPAAKEMRLADLVASSSCFPGGFEPLKFPHDFIHSNETELSKLLNQPRFKTGIGLMDGGIVDNQGIESVLAAIERKSTVLPDLFIISDVSTSYMKPFEFPEETGLDKMKFGLGMVNVLLIIGACLVAATLVLFIASFYQLWQAGDYIGLSSKALGLLIISALLLIFYKVQGIFRNDILGQIPRLGNRAWAYFKKISVGRVVDMSKLRAASMLTMVNDVTMKQIRRLIYNRVYKDKANRFQYSRVSNLIDSLTREKVIGRSSNSNYAHLVPSEDLLVVAEKALSTATTLWFTEKEIAQGKLNDLVASGEFTTCFRLIENIIQRYGIDATTYPPAIQKLYAQLLEDWNGFNDYPWMMVSPKG